MATREDILESIKNMSVLELSQLVKDMEEAFGVTGPEGFVDKPVDPVFLLQSVLGVVG